MPPRQSLSPVGPGLPFRKWFRVFPTRPSKILWFGRDMIAMMTFDIPAFYVRYVACWVAFCVLAAAILVVDRDRVRPEWRKYLGFLCVKWKLALFVPAFLFVTFAGRYTDDETWDIVTGSGMSILTFLTAPWSVGLVYQVRAGRRPWRYLVVAAALLLFSSSWFYDGYLLWRDGAYTLRWAGNLQLSPIVYVAAGLLWNLEAKGRWGFRLSFMNSDWPSRPADTRFLPLVLVSIPLILIAAFVLVAYVGWKLDFLRP